jgi:hypothetical protein
MDGAHDSSGSIFPRFLMLNRWHGKLTVLYVVAGCGLLDAALQLSGVS